MSRKRLRFAVLMDYAFSDYQEDFRIGIDRYMGESGLDAVYFGVGGLDSSRAEDRARARFFDFITPEEFDGVLIMSTSLVSYGDKDLADRLSRLRGLPLVSIGPSIIGEPNAIIDNGRGLDAVMRHLIEDHGYRRFAFVSGPRSSMEAESRLHAYRSALDSAGIGHSEKEEYYGNFLMPSGNDAVRAFLDERGLEPQVIVCASDMMAIGARDGLLAHGLSVPQDVAVTGFDDILLAHFFPHRLTTVRQSFDDLSYLAARRLHALARGEKGGEPIVMPAQLRIKSSCGCAQFARCAEEEDETGNEVEFANLRALAAAWAEAGCPPDGLPALSRVWTDTARKWIWKGRPVHDLEKTLRDINAIRPSPGGDGRMASFLHACYAQLLEECGQTVYSGHWLEQMASGTLRGAIDQLQYGLSQDLSLSAHPELFRGVAEICGAKSFSVLRFNDVKDILSGASVIYSLGGDASWTPRPGSWLPDAPGSLVVNMITAQEEPFGYFLVDERVAGESSFETMRSRFSTIFRDISVLKDVHALNSDLAKEIAIRHESEDKLKEALALVEEMAIKDALTGLNNRRGFFALAEQQLRYLRRQDVPFFLIFADVDGLKAINDAWGHKDGDLAIQSAAAALRKTLRDSDIIGRIGGDEFTAMVCSVDPPSFDIIRQRLMNNCANINLELGKPWKLSISLGCFYAETGCKLSLENMIEKADAEIYKQKQKKRRDSLVP